MCSTILRRAHKLLRTESIATPLFRRAIEGENKLSSPFAKNFNIVQWKDALSDTQDNKRDTKLCLSAIFFGQQVSSLRKQHVEKIFKGISKRSALILAVGSANRNYLVLKTDSQKKQLKNASSKNTEPFHLMDGGKVDSQIALQKNLSSDDLITSIVDTLPHWFFEAKELADEREPITTDFGHLEQIAGWVLSVEAGLRDLWMSALWEAREFKNEGEALVFGPTDHESDAYWFASQMRTEAALFGPVALFHDLPEDREDTRHVKIVSVSQSRMGHARLNASKPSPRKLRKLNETMNILDRSYIKDFLDELVAVAGANITMRLLVQALWLLGELGSGMTSNVHAKTIRSYRDAKDFSLRISKKNCLRAFREGLGIEERVAKSVLSQLLLRPDDSAKCFRDGAWFHPLVELDEEHVMIILPAVEVGATIRFVERTLSELLGADLTKVKSLGETFERSVRARIQSALTGNQEIFDFSCLPHALDKVNDGGEEIDLLFRIGDCIVVGEVKCLVAPSESIDRFNHLSKLEQAAVQAKRKVEWLSSNLDLLEGLFGIEIGKVNIVPLVVLNQRVGSGLVVNGVAITDIFFLELFAAGGSYSSGAAMTKGKKAVTFETFYTNQKEAEAAIPSIFVCPPPLKRFINGIEWVKVEFPVGFGEIFLEHPRLKSGALVTPELEAAAKVLALD